MLEEIQIENLGIIEKANLEFSPGLTVISGETGAGKTMILTGLRLLLGRRSSSDAVGLYDDRLSVEGCWQIEDSNPIKTTIVDTGAKIDEGELFINRTVDNAGKSKSSIGGKRTPSSLLKEIGDRLVAIHGQSDQIKLKDATAQLEAIDRFGGDKLKQTLETYDKAYSQWRLSAKNLKNASESSTQRKLELNALTAFVESFDEIDPQENEIEILETRIEELSHMEVIKETVEESYGLLYGDGGDEVTSINDLFSDLTGLLKRIGKYSILIKEYSENAEEIESKLSELTFNLEDYLHNIDANSLQELAEAKDRLIDLKDFVRRNGGDLTSILETYENSSKKLKELEESSGSIEELKEVVIKKLATLELLSQEVTTLRKESALALSLKVNEELAGLAMKGSNLVIHVKKLEKFTKNGQDEIEFLIKAAGRNQALPINKAASGGELSRIMLALEVSLNDKNAATTLVFDEIDSGVGGATAIEIGKRLAKLAKDSQVIVVTHLPQVACYADSNLKVSKTEPTNQNETVKVSVEKLSEEEKVQEITRMLSGVVDSTSGREHAQELLSMAQQHKSSFNHK